MALKLTDEELQAIHKIAVDSGQGTERLLDCLEQLSYGDAPLGCRMQAGAPCGLLPWMEKISELSDRISYRLQHSESLENSISEANQEAQASRAALEKFVIENRDLEALEAKIAKFNIFEAVGMVRQEIKHSRLLRFLLDPSEKHRLGDLFLKKFLVSILTGAENLSLTNLEIALADFSDAEVKCEWKYIDILIHSPSNDLVCVIGNKVDSSEHGNQLCDYEQTIYQEFPDYRKVFLYLTKEGIPVTCQEWLPIEYGTVASILEHICNE